VTLECSLTTELSSSFGPQGEVKGTVGHFAGRRRYKYGWSQCGVISDCHPHEARIGLRPTLR